MSKKYTIILIGITLIVAGYVYQFIDSGTKNGDMKNVEIMNSENQTPISTIENLEYFEGAKGYFARPKAPGNYPGIVMIHENRGLRPEIKSTADMLAKEGYLVLAVDLLGGTAEDQAGAKVLTSKFDQQTGIQNMQTASTYLKAQGATKLASIGWCFGGKQSLEFALSGPQLDATVVYYGGGMATSSNRLKAISWPVLGVFGDKDTVLPLTMVEQFKSSLAELKIENEVYIYPGVGHAFANPSGANYAPEETMDAWNKTLTFLNKHLK